MKMSNNKTPNLENRFNFLRANHLCCCDFHFTSIVYGIWKLYKTHIYAYSSRERENERKGERKNNIFLLRHFMVKQIQ